MSLIRMSSPHVTRSNTSSGVMQLVLLAMIPGILALTLFFGWGTLLQIAICLISGLVFEALALRLRGLSVSLYLGDYSATVTALLLAVSIPPSAPVWIGIVGMFVAILFAKQVYGGIGNNPFNPAMVAYALLLVSFPVQMTSWNLPYVLSGSEGWSIPALSDSLSLIFAGSSQVMDAYTGATPLDILRNRDGFTTEEMWRSNQTLIEGAAAYHAVSAAWFMGGIYLIYKKVFTWHTPVSILVTLGLVSAIAYGVDPSNFVDPFNHLTLGATMLAAFFIATDPVSSATSNRGRIVFGIGIGLLIFIIRTWGNYPDAVAFSVLLMNLAAPMIDHYTQPRSYGHKRPRLGPKGE